MIVCFVVFGFQVLSQPDHTQDLELKFSHIIRQLIWNVQHVQAQYFRAPSKYFTRSKNNVLMFRASTLKLKCFEVQNPLLKVHNPYGGSQPQQPTGSLPSRV